MFIKQFRTVKTRVPDPTRPGKRVFEDRLLPTGAAVISHAGRTFEADDDGWFEVPPDVASALSGFRHPDGSRFYGPAEVDDMARLGAVAAPAPRKTGRKKNDD